MANNSGISAFLQCKCPQCRQGKIFTYNILEFKNFSQTNTNCSVCGLKFEVEPGFFWGAIYFGYALNVALGVSSGIAIFILFKDPPIWVYITSIIGLILVMIPVNYRYARVGMLYLFGSIKYKPGSWKKIPKI